MKKYIAMLTVIALIGCNEMDSGSGYIGKWANTKSNDRILEISKNGENFIVRVTKPRILDGKLETTNIPAIYKDGVLKASSDLDTRTYMIDKVTGNLLDGKFEYKREK